MTQYVEGPALGKVGYLTANGATVLPEPPASLEAIQESAAAGLTTVLVVNNGFFEAAGVIDSARDFRDFQNPADNRPKTWLEIPTTVLKTLL